MIKKAVFFLVTAALFSAFLYPDNSLQLQTLVEEKYRAKIENLIKGIYGEERKVSVEVTLFPLETPFNIENRETYSLTAVVFIDGRWKFVMNEKNRFVIESGGIRKRESILLGKEEITELEEAIKNLTGFNEKRGDVLQVSSIEFDRTALFRQEDSRWSKKSRRVFSFVTLFFVLFFMFAGILVYRIITKDIEYRRKLRESELERDFILRAGEKKRFR